VIPYGKQTIEDDDIAAVTAVLRGDWLTQGPRVAAFEAALAEACEAPYAVAFSSGTAALHAACHAAGVGAGDDVLTSALTFAASANCAAYVGATPRFADIDPATFNVSRDTVGAALTDRTRAVIPVSFAGLPAPLREIRSAIGPGVTLIEDAAHALGARTPDGPVGNVVHADMSVFSFHPVKSLTTGEGGAITVRDEALRDRLLAFRSHGMTKDPTLLERPDEGGWYMEQQDLGFNYRITDLQCALGVSQLAKLERFVAARNAIADRYRAGLSGVEGVALPPAAPDGARHAYHLFVVRVRARRALYDALRERGILSQVHYVPVYLHPWYRRTYGYAPGLCPAAETYYDGCLSLPCFPALTEAEQDSVIEAVRELV
jgi:UDP-4-amino-4,6-dideoxy-N-acetyl-beta-L-altrosamine transaminase